MGKKINMSAKMPTITKQQLVLIIEEDPTLPSTRFQGSNLKIVDWFWEAIKYLSFNSALDAFGGIRKIGKINIVR